MRWSRPLSAWLTPITDHVAVMTAVRGTLAAATLYLGMRAAGEPGGALFATIAALNVSIADGGGPYRSRLAMMLLITALMPVVIVLGGQVRTLWWLAAIALFAIAMLGGLARSFGQAGTSLGVIAALVLLVGIEVPASFAQDLGNAAFYAIGAAWTLLITLLVWRLRPYRRLRYELAACFTEAARLTGAVRALCAAHPAPDAEHAVDIRQRTFRTAYSQIHAALGEAVSDHEGGTSTLADLVVLLRAVARMSGAVLSLPGALRAADRPADQREGLEAILAELAELCQELASLLNDTGRRVAVETARTRLDVYLAHQAASPGSAVLAIGLEQAMRHLEIAQNAALRVVEEGSRARGLMPPLHRPSAVSMLEALGANLSMRSFIFRHALRVGLAAGAGAALMLRLRLPHGIWVPLTTLIVLQPSFGATLQRAGHRIAGTILGAVIAAVLILVLRGTFWLDIAILAMFFCTLLFLKRNYAVGVVFVTPLIILLLDQVEHAPWTDLGFRLMDTLAGAALALVAGYILWPSWEAERLPDRLAGAVEAHRSYLGAVFEALARGSGADAALGELRRTAGLELENAEAAYERMSAEPHRRGAARVFAALTHLRRLNRHVTELAVYRGRRTLDARQLAALAVRFDAPLKAVADALRGTAAQPAEALDDAHAPLHDASGDAVRRAVAEVIDRLIADVNSLCALGEVNAAG